ncbi:integral membrane protein [Mycolicibacterium conceptionense]|uniref:Integral membrane protein n=1 Tax=Mycolicibacterium conceptionense TaxID=451644 RepID=A0A0U1DWL3_9MYCO|nr:integral membrane protein [Mycolicibacterium conceptionense]
MLAVVFAVALRHVHRAALAAVTEREPAPLKFAQLVGFVFAAVGTAGFAFGVTALGLTATAFALVAAFLNAAFGICLGCQLYPLVARLRHIPSPA